MGVKGSERDSTAGITQPSGVQIFSNCCGIIGKMADLEAVLADVSYLMAMEKSKSTPAARASKKIILPDPR